MDEILEKIVSSHAPEYWVRGAGNTTFLNRDSSEFVDISEELYRALNRNWGIKTIRRHQNVCDFGQFLVREQHLLHLQPQQNYYRVRRFIKIEPAYLQQALQHNLDYRRCGMTSLKFCKNIPNVVSGDIVIVVQVIVSDFNKAEIVPERSCDYFIDYIVEL